MTRKRLTREEAFIKKRFEKEGFTAVKLDLDSNHKAPDFKFSKPDMSLLAEVKIGFKKGQVLEKLSTGAERIDPSLAVEEYFSEATTQLNGHLSYSPADKKLPFVIIFIQPFFIDKELEWSNEPYQKYKNISAIFIPKRIHPLDDKADEMTLEELERIIKSPDVPFESQLSWGWIVIKNPYAINPLKITKFTSTMELKRLPTKK